MPAIPRRLKLQRPRAGRPAPQSLEVHRPPEIIVLGTTAPGAAKHFASLGWKPCRDPEWSGWFEPPHNGWPLVRS